MQATVTGTIVAGALTLPDDCREIQSLRVRFNGYLQELQALPPSRLYEDDAATSPVGYVMLDDSVQLIGSTGDYTYALTYWKAVPALSDSATQNWLILREPGLYLYGALAESAPFMKEDERLLTWGTLYNSIRDGMHRESDRARYGNTATPQVNFRAP